MPARFDFSYLRAPSGDKGVNVLGIEPGYRYFGPNNETREYTPEDLVRPKYEVYARRHDKDVESALKISNADRRKQALDRADLIFMKNMDKVGFRYPKEWLMSRVFKTGVQKFHYGKYLKNKK